MLPPISLLAIHRRSATLAAAALAARESYSKRRAVAEQHIIDGECHKTEAALARRSAAGLRRPFAAEDDVAELLPPGAPVTAG